MQILTERRRDEAERLGIEAVQPDHEGAQTDHTDLEGRERTVVDVTADIDRLRQISLPLLFHLSDRQLAAGGDIASEISCMTRLFPLATKFSSIHKVIL